jgi:hypothetical protein
MATKEQLSLINDQEMRLKIAYSEGMVAALAKTFSTDYHGGSGLSTYFSRGFVEVAATQPSLPEGTPMYLAGRVAFLKGLKIEDMPESESFTGRWFSGWLTEKDRFIRSGGIIEDSDDEGMNGPR